jgi:hypothetical protein
MPPVSPGGKATAGDWSGTETTTLDLSHLPVRMPTGRSPPRRRLGCTPPWDAGDGRMSDPELLANLNKLVLAGFLTTTTATVPKYDLDTSSMSPG